MNERVVNASLLSATQAVAVFTSVMPTMSEVRKNRSDAAIVNDTRTAEKAGGTIVIGVGVLASIMVRDPMPGMVAVLVTLVMIALYETILLSKPKEISRV